MRMMRAWMNGCRRFGRTVRTLVRDQKANVLIIVGLAAPVIFGTAGFAVDYGYASYLKRSLDQAADASALAATSQSAAASGGGYSNTSWLRTFGVNTFTGNTSKLNISVTPTMTVTSKLDGSGGVIATTSYTYNVPTYFSSFLGIPTIPIAGTATATANPITYIDYYILVDISQSMGIGATQSDMNALYARTLAAGNEGCVFGCHVTAPGDKAINEQLAHNQSPRITLRIDSAVAAIQNIIADAQAAAGTQKNIRIGLYTMSDDPTTGGQQVNTISSPTSDYAGLTTKAAAITLGNNTSAGVGDSNFSPQVTKFNALVSANGTGLLSSSPKNYAFIITDALTDYAGSSCTYGHCTSAFDPSNCTTLKLKATVGTIYTTYLPIYLNNNSTPNSNGTYNYDGRYTPLAKPYIAQLAPNMQICATNTSLYYEASDGPAINAAMKALFASTLQTARLTQ